MQALYESLGAFAAPFVQETIARSGLVEQRHRDHSGLFVPLSYLFNSLFALSFRSAIIQ